MTFKILYGNGCSMAEGAELGNVQFNYDITDPTPNSCRAGLRRINTRESLAHMAYMEENCWPSLLANHMNIPTIKNSAIGGSSNYRIARTSIADLTELLTKFKPEEIFVVVGWSGLTRSEIFQDGFYRSYIPAFDLPKNINREMTKFVLAKNSAIPSNLNSILTDFIKNIMSLKAFLRHHKIKYVFSVGIIEHISKVWDDQKVIKELNDSSIKAMFDSMGIYDEWFTQKPSHSIGDFKHFMMNTHELSFNYFVSRNKLERGPGKHPLEEAHRQWASVMYEFINARFENH